MLLLFVEFSQVCEEAFREGQFLGHSVETGSPRPPRRRWCTSQWFDVRYPWSLVLVHNYSRRRNSYGANALVAGAVISCRNDVVKSWWMLNAYVWKSPLVSGSGLWTLSFPHAPESFPSNIRLLAIFVINPQCEFSGVWRLYCKNPRISLLFRIPSSYNGGHDWQIPDVAIFFLEGVAVSVQLISTSSKYSSVEPVMYCWMRFWHSLSCILFKHNLCK